MSARDRGPRQAIDLVRRLLSFTDSEVDYGAAKLALDWIVEPSVNPPAMMTRLQHMRDCALRLAGASPSAADKLEALRTLIYKPGTWNRYRPIKYHRVNPWIPEVQTLSHCLATGQGNCVSMPILFLILGRKLGLDLALASAPRHFFLHYREEGGRVLNLEATSGAQPARDIWIRRQMPMTDLALTNGLYMRSLSPAEAVAAMVTPILAHLLDQARYAEAAEIAQIVLRHHPRHVDAMLTLGTVYGRLADDFRKRFPFPCAMPNPLRTRVGLLLERNASLFAAAEALGWKPEEMDVPVSEI